MAQRDRTRSFKIWDSEQMDSDLEGDALRVSWARNVAVHIIASNTDVVGELVFVGSNDRENFVEIPYVDSSGDAQDGYDVASGSAVNEIFNFGDPGVTWFSVDYNRTGGSDGYLTAIVTVKK